MEKTENIPTREKYLQDYQDPDISFYAVKFYKSEDEFNLQLGEEYIEESESMDDNEIIQWAKGAGYLNDEDWAKEEGYINEDGSIEIESLRDRKRNWEQDYPSTSASPAGRAFLWFIHKRFSFPEDLNLKFVEGLHPGSDWQGVVVNGYDSLIELQSFLLNTGIKVNFEFKEEY